MTESFLAKARAARPQPPPTVHPPRTTRTANGHGYGHAALAGETDRVRGAAAGTRNDTLNRAAFSLGQLVAGGELTETEVRDELTDAARTAGLEDREISVTIASGLGKGMLTPRQAPQVTDSEIADRAITAGFVDPLAETLAYLASPESRVPKVPKVAKVANGVDPAGEREPTRLSSRMLTRSQLANLPPVEPLIADTLSLRSSVVLIGPTGAGKTFLALSWACCVATGMRWLGRAVVRAPVLYVVGEGASGLDARVDAWEQMYETKVGDDDLMFAIRPDSLTNTNTWADINVEARAMGARLVVLDTFSSLAPDADETKDAAMTLRRLADLAAAIDGTALMVHHPGWGDVERARGGSQIEANADEVVLLRGNAHSDLVEMERKKCKEGAAGGKTWLRRKQVGNSVAVDLARPEDSMTALGDTVEDTVRDLFSGDTVSSAQIRDAVMERLGLSRTVAYQHIKRLQASGVLSRAGGTDNRPTFKVV